MSIRHGIIVAETVSVAFAPTFGSFSPFHSFALSLHFSLHCFTAKSRLSPLEAHPAFH